MYKTSVIWLSLLLSLVLGGCTTPAVRQAEAVTAQADSLWQAGKMYGIDEGDSASLAQACETLSTFNSPLLSTFNYQLSTDFSRLCYHYGRLLRAKDNPVAAMQVFIDATHSRTRDYHILGRVYSNIGDLCHLAGDFPLSYDMFSRSADCFLRNGDTIAYYFLLNDMAFELAEQGKEKETLALLDSIIRHCEEEGLIAKTWETKAELYYQIAKYESAIYCVNHSKSLGNNQPTGTLIKAQAFSYLGENDSALVYANWVLNNVFASSQNKFNALYVITHNDSSLCAEKMRDLTSQREDIRYYEYEPVREKLVQADLLLQQDIKKQTTYKKTGFYVFVVLIILIPLIVYIIYRIKQNRMVFLKDKEMALQELKEHEEALVVQQQQALQQQAEFSLEKEKLCCEIENRCKLLHNSEDFKTQLYWRQYNNMCQFIDGQFYMFTSKLKQVRNIKERDVRLCVLVLLNFSYTEIAKWMYVEEGSVGKLKERTAKKLQTNRKDMRQTLLKIVIGED